MNFKRLNSNKPRYQNESSLLDLIETIITYKFPRLTREEVKKMLHIPDIHLDIRQTQFYRDVFFEGQQEGKLEGELKIIFNLLKRRFGELNEPLMSQITALNICQLDSLSEHLLDFKQLDDLVRWLNRDKV